MTQKDFYLCTRPSLASILMENGYTCKRVPNPFSPKRMAWQFKNGDDLQEIVSDYYASIKHERHEGGKR